MSRKMPKINPTTILIIGWIVVTALGISIITMTLPPIVHELLMMIATGLALLLIRLTIHLIKLDYFKNSP